MKPFAVPSAIAAIALCLSVSAAEPAADQPYKVIKTAKVGGPGSFDYVFADAEARRLYVPRGGAERGAPGRVTVFDLDTLKSVGEVSGASAVHGVAIDPKSAHGFSSSKPVVMFDTKTLATIKTIDVEGSPDGILFDPATGHIFVLSHRAPNATVINAADGAVVGTLDLGGQPEQGASDGNGKLYICLEDKSSVAVVDSKALKVIARYDLAGKGGTPAGLCLDAANRVLFVFGRNPQTAVIMNADDGKILTALPIGSGVDAAEFNPATREAFSSQRDGTLTVIKEKSPSEFEVAQTVQTKPGAKTSTLDGKTGRIVLITAEMAAPTPAAGQAQPAGGGAGGGGGRPRGQMVPDSFTILVVGR
jgi:DNA-binding beta-propeller fold protein YncE